jgi:hypothetical protein
MANRFIEEFLCIAYLDAELPRVAMRWTEQHLQSCWECRSALAEVELLAQRASKLLFYQDESDIARTGVAKEKFLQLKTTLEVRWKELPKARFFFFMPCKQAMNPELSLVPMPSRSNQKVRPVKGASDQLLKDRHCIHPAHEELSRRNPHRTYSDG